MEDFTFSLALLGALLGVLNTVHSLWRDRALKDLPKRLEARASFSAAFSPAVEEHEDFPPRGWARVETACGRVFHARLPRRPR